MSRPKKSEERDGGAEILSPRWSRVASSISESVDVDSPAGAAVPRVLKTLLMKIDAGEYRAGQKINTVNLAKDLGLSRAPVREALHILAGKGIVKLLPDRGAIIRPFSKERLIESYEILDCIMPFAFRVASQRINDGDNRDTILHHRARIGEAALEPPSFRFWFVIHDFLHAVAQIAGNSIIDDIMFSLNLDLQARTLEETAMVEMNHVKYAQTYQRQIDAMLEGDWRSAEAIAHYHIENQVNLLRTLDL